jgi:hypothetical protein
MFDAEQEIEDELYNLSLLALRENKELEEELLML